MRLVAVGVKAEASDTLADLALGSAAAGRSIWRRHWPLALVLVLFLSVGLVYSVLIPVLEAPDELQHYRFLEHLALTGQLPVQTGKDPSNLVGQEASQPPLYYLLATALSFWAYDRPAAIERNPHTEIGLPTALTALDNKNLLQHSVDEQFPYHGLALAVHLARWFSLLLGAVAVACTYLLALRLGGQSRALATGAAAACAFLPMFVFMSAAINNDNLVIALSSVALVLFVRALDGHQQRHDFAVMGVVLGLAALSKLTALGLFGLLALVCAVLAWRERALWRYLGRGLLAGGIAFIIAGWWYLRNLALYGELLGINAMLRAVGRRHPTPTLWDLAGEMGDLKMSYWGVFGWNNIALPAWFYQFYDALAVLALLGLLLALVRSWRSGRWPKMAAWSLMLIWPGAVLVALLNWTQMTLATYGRLLLPAVACLSLLLFFGLASLVPRRAHPSLALFLALVLFSLAAVAPFQSLVPAYRGWPYDALALSQPFSGGIELVALKVGPGWRGQPREGGGVLVQPTGPITSPLSLTLYWRAVRTPAVSYTVTLQLIDSAGQRADQYDCPPKDNARPTTTWLPGEIVADPRRFDRIGDLPPGKYTMVLILYQRETMARLPLPDGKDYLVLGEVSW